MATPSKKRQKRRMGARPPRYSFILNPYRDVRFSKCPRCEANTKVRKFPLAIHVNGLGLVTLGKTCRLCVACEILIAHRDEIDPLIERLLSGRPNPANPDYLVLGTVKRDVWRRGLQTSLEISEMLEAMADFKTHLRVEYQPRGWYKSDG